MKPLVIKICEAEFIIYQGECRIFGRDPGRCDIVLADDRISRKHATLEYDSSGQIYLTDHKSKNGTYFNGIEIKNRQQIFPPGIINLSKIELFLEQKDMIAEKRKIKSHETETNLEIPSSLKNPIHH